MFVQILLGILFLVQGICSLANHPIFCRKDVLQHLSNEKKKKYFIARGIVLCLAALLFFVMAFVEKEELFPTAIFLCVYAEAILLLVVVQIRINKKLGINLYL